MNKSKKYLDYELDEEELQILEDIENDKYVSLKETNPKKFKKEMEVAQIATKQILGLMVKVNYLY